MGFANKERKRGGGQMGHLNFSERNKYFNDSKSVLLFTHNYTTYKIKELQGRVVKTGR